MKAIYNNSQNSLIAFKGEYEPIQFYKGGQLIDNISAVPLSIEGNPSNFKTEYNKSLIKLDLKGNTVQKSYEGYNLFDIFAFKKGESLGYTIDPNGVVEFAENGLDVRYSVKITFEPGTYILSADCTYGCLIGGQLFGNNGSDYSWVSYNAPSKYFTFSTKKTVAVYIVKSTSTTIGTISNIQITKSETVLSYEPYVGGKPSPNAEYPQPINSSSNIELMLSGAKLYDDNLYLLRNTVSKVGKEYDFRGYPVVYHSDERTALLYKQVKNNLKPNIKYTMASKWSSRGGGSSGNLQLRGDSDRIKIKDNFVDKENILKLNVINLSKSELNILNSLWIYGTSPSQMDLGNPPTIGNAMIFVGEYTAETLPPFDEPYIEPTTVNIPIELNKLGDVADELVIDYSAKTVKLIKRIEKFYLKDQIKSVVIDTSWEPGNVALVTTTDAWESGDINLCSHCKYFAEDTSILSFECQNNAIQFYIVNQSTPKDFIQWVTDNNVQMALVRYSPEVIDYSSKDWAQELLNLPTVRNQTNVITITSDLPISEQNIKYAKWGGNIEN